MKKKKFFLIMVGEAMKFLRSNKYGTGKKAAIIVSIFLAIALVLFLFSKSVPYIIVLIFLCWLCIPDSFWARLRQQRAEEEALRQKNRQELMEAVLIVIIIALGKIGKFFPIGIPKEISDMNPSERTWDGLIVIGIQILLLPGADVDWKDFVRRLNALLKRIIDGKRKGEGAFPDLVVIFAADDPTCYGYGHFEVAVIFSQADAQKADARYRSFLNELPDSGKGAVYDDEF